MAGFNAPTFGVARAAEALKAKEQAIGAWNTRDEMRREFHNLSERVHYAEGTADLAMKHRDDAEAMSGGKKG